MTRNEPPGCLAFFLRLFRPTPAAALGGAAEPVAVPAPTTPAPAQPVVPVEQPAPASAERVANLAACRVQPNFMSSDEQEFFRFLSQAVVGRYVIFSKVGLGSLFDVPRVAGETDWKTRGQFSQKHVDFLLCAPTSLKPILGIELDDPSHRRPESLARDKIKDDVFTAAELPLLRIPTQRTFDAEDIAARIAAKLRDAAGPVDAASADAETEGNALSAAVPACPRCGRPMKRKTARQGPRSGSEFYSCTDFPACRGTRSIN